MRAKGSAGPPVLGVLVVCALAKPASAQSWIYSKSITASYEIDFNVTYVKLGDWEGKLDVYSRTDVPGPHPTLIYFHGGGALGSGGRKDMVTLDLLPYLEWGWDVVNVDYNLPGLTLAPVAVQNGVCAVRWVAANAKMYGFDSERLVTSGWSSGGWMALMTGMALRTSDWDRLCPATGDVKIAAVVNRPV